MREAMARLRAALTPGALLLLGAALLLVELARGGGGGGYTELERRTSQTLSGMAGAGEVSVVILSRETMQQGAAQGLGLTAGSAAQTPVGAIAVAQGADDPLVRMELEAALCALLGLPGSAVNVMAGGE